MGAMIPTRAITHMIAAVCVEPVGGDNVPVETCRFFGPSFRQDNVYCVIHRQTFWTSVDCYLCLLPNSVLSPSREFRAEPPLPSRC